MPSDGGWWVESVLHSFAGSDGALPDNGIVFDNVGNIYSTTGGGGDLNCNFGLGCGAVFELSPSGSGWDAKGALQFRRWKRRGVLPSPA